MLTTTGRIRSIVSECRTEADVQSALRFHKIKYHYTTESGFLSVVVPCLTGSVRIYRTASKSRPFAVTPTHPEPYYHPNKNVLQIG